MKLSVGQSKVACLLLRFKAHMIKKNGSGIINLENVGVVSVDHSLGLGNFSQLASDYVSGAFLILNDLTSIGIITQVFPKFSIILVQMWSLNI